MGHYQRHQRRYCRASQVGQDLECRILNSIELCVRFLVHQGCIPPLCDLLTVMDSKIVQVALNGLENILRFGEQESKNTGGPNPYAVIIEEVFGLDKIEFLQVSP